MNDNSEFNSHNRIRSVFDYSAHGGVPMGILLTFISLAFIGSLRLEFLRLLTIPALLAVPALLYRQMTIVWRDAPHLRKISGLWLFGIYVFIFGTLICTLVSALYVTFVEPNFVADYLRASLESFRAMPDPEAFANEASVIESALQHKAIPSPMSMLISIGWATCFFGSMLSLMLASIILSVRRRRPAKMA